MAVTMKNGVFWDIKPSSYLTGYTLRFSYIPSQRCYVRFEVFAAVTTKNAVFWGINPVHTS
jgi:hypothetical protein